MIIILCRRNQRKLSLLPRNIFFVKVSNRNPELNLVSLYYTKEGTRRPRLLEEGNTWFLDRIKWAVDSQKDVGEIETMIPYTDSFLLAKALKKSDAYCSIAFHPYFHRRQSRTVLNVLNQVRFHKFHIRNSRFLGYNPSIYCS